MWRAVPVLAFLIVGAYTSAQYPLPDRPRIEDYIPPAPKKKPNSAAGHLPVFVNPLTGERASLKSLTFDLENHLLAWEVSVEDARGKTKRTRYTLNPVENWVTDGKKKVYFPPEEGKEVHQEYEWFVVYTLTTGLWHASGEGSLVPMVPLQDEKLPLSEPLLRARLLISREK